MKAVGWVTRQAVIMILSWLLAAVWLSVIFWFLDVESSLIWLVGGVAAAILPVISFAESLLMLLIKRKNRMGFFDNLFTAVFLVIVPFVGGFYYFVGDCLQCEPIVSSFIFSIMIFSIPTALVQSTIRKLIVKI